MTTLTREEFLQAQIDALRAEIAQLKAQAEWRPIASAPKDESVLLYCNKNIPMYIGRQRRGKIGEPQQDAFAWRCDSSGRFATPTLWQPKPTFPPPPQMKE